MDNPVISNISSLTLRDKVLDLSMPQIMGILNFTPDSFSDGGQFNSLKPALEQIEQMISQGASIIDVGGESTRPGSDPVSTQEELDRVAPVLEKAVPAFPDTFFPLIQQNIPWPKRRLGLEHIWLTTSVGYSGSRGWHNCVLNIRSAMF